MKFKSLIALLLFTTLTAADPVQSFHLSSRSFSQGQPIPRIFTSDGGNEIPPLTWWGEPSGTQQFALLMYDPDAPRVQGTSGPFIHWLVYNIPEGTTDISDALSGGAAAQAPNSFGQRGYNGPYPPAGGPAHRYVFALYALDSTLSFPVSPTSAQVLSTITGHVLEEATLMGTYQRS
jgi:Raf kinase inhibitor-like YbhB/YbcL family protein